MSVFQVKLSQMDGTPPLPSDLLKKNGQAETVQIVFTGKIGTQWPYKYERLNETFPIQPSGLTRFTVDVPENFNSIAISVCVNCVICQFHHNLCHFSGTLMQCVRIYRINT